MRTSRRTCVTRTNRLFVLTLATAAALACGLPAEAAGRGNRERVRERAPLQETGAVDFGRAGILVQRQSLQNQSILLRASGAPAATSFLVFLADENGTLTEVGTARAEGRSGRVEWKVRTARGDPLPFGVADVADLSGRAVEVHAADGTVVLTGTMPVAAKATGLAKRVKSLRTGLAVDDDVAGSSVTADLEFERHRGGATLTIELDGAASGLALEAWIRGTDGTFQKLGDLVEESEQGDDEGDDSADDDGSGSDDDLQATVSGTLEADDADDAEEVPDGDAEYSFTIDPSAGLPFGATSLADLAGLEIEIRNAADGTVVASGFLPDVSPPDDAEEDQDEQGDDDLGDGDSSSD
jgi:hypothetical protein